jgi:hypothetical protein
MICVLVCAGCLLAGAALAQSPVRVTVNTQSPGLIIPSDFLGLSFETVSLQDKSPKAGGRLFDATNTQCITLFKNFGVKNLRIGGSSVDARNSTNYMPTDSDIDALFHFAKASSVNVIYSLCLLNGNSKRDASAAKYVWDNYRKYLLCFAIGNEPDFYKKGRDHEITNDASFVAKWIRFAGAVTNAVPEAKFGGPDNGGPDNPDGGASWASIFAKDEMRSGMVTWIFSHEYVGGNSKDMTVPQIIEGMLSANWDASNYPAYYNATEAAALSAGFPFRLTEFNSYSTTYPGTWGGNNSFASALYALDSTHWWAAHNCQGVNFHTIVGKYNGTIYRDANGNYQVYPIAYGLKAFDVGGHGGVMPLTISNADLLNLTAYAVGDTTNLYVTIINKEHGANARSAAVTILPNGLVNGSAEAMFLTAPQGNVGATNGVTLGGATITNNAPWRGQWTRLRPVMNGSCAVTVPAASAVVVKILAAQMKSLDFIYSYRQKPR